MTQTAQEMRLKIVKEGRCDPYRPIDQTERPEPREDAICVECRHCIENNTWSDNLEWRYSCRNDPQYEEHRNFVNGEAMFFNRERWDHILECRKKWGEDWSAGTKEKDCFHVRQIYGSCMKINTDGSCENFERPPDVKRELAKEGRLWPLYARGALVGAALGFAGALLASCPFT
jgi:hypothetical protein